MIATCGRCAARWSGGRTAHCGGCHRTFGGVTGFDRHRDRAGACRDPATVGLEERGGAWRDPPLDVTRRPAYWVDRADGSDGPEGRPAVPDGPRGPTEPGFRRRVGS